jgi:hypothetical protein
VNAVRYLEYSEFNSEFLQVAGGWREAERAVSMACGEIPCATEPGS